MKLSHVAANAAMPLILAGALLLVLNVPYAWSPLLIGGVALAIVRIRQRLRQARTANATRLHTILLFSSALMILTSYLAYSGRNYWILPLAISAAIELYASFRPR